MELNSPNKSLGQHWLDSDEALNEIVKQADLKPADTVLEIGSGTGNLTLKLLGKVKKVVAVELDQSLSNLLTSKINAPNLEVYSEDILKFNFSRLPLDYKVVANIPYYLTSNLLRTLCESSNPFSLAIILVQKEVAERVSATPGEMSLLSVSVQYYCETSLGKIIPAKFFTPPPKVDSCILRLNYRKSPLFTDVDPRLFFRIVKAGFSQRRKTLLNSLSAGLNLERPQTLKLLDIAKIEPTQRAQTLSLNDWNLLYDAYSKMLP